MKGYAHSENDSKLRVDPIPLSYVSVLSTNFLSLSTLDRSKILQVILVHSSSLNTIKYPDTILFVFNELSKMLTSADPHPSSTPTNELPEILFSLAFQIISVLLTTHATQHKSFPDNFAFYNISVYTESTLAHIISSALCIMFPSSSSSSSAYSVALKIQAADALRNIILNMHPRLVAGFAPGILSSLSANLTKNSGRKVQGIWIDHQLECLQVILLSMFDQRSHKQSTSIDCKEEVKSPIIDHPQSGNFISWADSDNDDSSQEYNSSAMSRIPSFKISRNSKWFEETSGRINSLLNMILTANDGPSVHPSVTVQKRLTLMSSSLLLNISFVFNRFIFNSLVIILLKSTLHSDTSVSTAAEACLKLLFNNHRLPHSFTNILQDLFVSSFIQPLLNEEVLLKQLDEKEKIADLVSQFAGIINALDSYGSLSSVIQNSSRVSLCLAKCAYLVMTAYLQPHFDNQLLYGKQNEASIYLNDYYIDTFIHSCSRISQNVDFVFLYPHLIELAKDEENVESAAGAVLVLNTFLQTENTGERWSQLAMDIIDSSLYSRIWSSDSVIDKPTALYTILVVRGIHTVANNLQHFKPFVLHVLLPLVICYNSNPCELLRQEAHITLKLIAKKSQLGSIGELYKAHLNFLIDKVTRNLSSSWTGSVLKDVLTTVGEESILLLHDVFIAECHKLSSMYNFEARYFFEMMKEVLTILKVDGQPHSRYPTPYVEKHENHLDVIKSKLSIFVKDAEDSDTEPQILSNEEDEKVDNLEQVHDSNSAVLMIAEEAIYASVDALVGRPWQVRAAALNTAISAILILSGNKKRLLPAVATLISLIPAQFEEEVGSRMRSLDVIGCTCSLICALFECCPEFVSARFVQEIWPNLLSILGQLWETHMSYDLSCVLTKALDCVNHIGSRCPERLTKFTEELLDLLLPFFNEEIELIEIIYRYRENDKPFPVEKHGKSKEFHRRRALAAQIIDSLIQIDPDKIWMRLGHKYSGDLKIEVLDS